MKLRAHQLLWLSGILILAAAALMPILAQDSRPPQPPIIRAQYEGKLFDGTADSACYPRPDNAPLCTFVDAPNPKDTITAREDRTITFVISPAQPAPQAFSIAFIDAAPPNAEPPTRDLLATNGVLTLENLSPNRQRVLVTAIYPSDRGQGEFFVSYAFALQVLPRPTETPTFTSTPSPTATDAPTSTPTATSTPTLTSTRTPTNTPPPVVTFTPPPEASPIFVVTPTPLVAETPTPAETPQLQPSPTPTLSIPTLAPETPAIQATPEVQPSPALTITPTLTLTPPPPTLTPTITPTLAPLSDLGYPNVQLIIGDVAFTPIALVGCLNLSIGQRCLSTPLESPIIRVVGAAGSIAQLEFAGAQPESVVVNLFEADGITLISSQSLSLRPTPVYILPIEAGVYTLGIEVIWQEGNATYFFRLLVGGED